MSKNAKVTKTNAMRALDAQNIAYTHTAYQIGRASCRERV